MCCWLPENIFWTITTTHIHYYLPPLSLPPSDFLEFLFCNCIGPYFCDTSNDSCVGETTDDIHENACIIFKQFEENGVNFVHAKCLASNAFDFLFYCEDPLTVSWYVLECLYCPLYVKGQLMLHRCETVIHGHLQWMILPGTKEQHTSTELEQ